MTTTHERDITRLSVNQNDSQLRGQNRATSHHDDCQTHDQATPEFANEITMPRSASETMRPSRRHACVPQATISAKGAMKSPPCAEMST
jgi:hypothetical protein